MNFIVTKFGGSSLADSIHFKKVKNIIESNCDRRYVIPSAPGKGAVLWTHKTDKRSLWESSPA